MLDRFAVRGIIAGFWFDNKNEFRTLQARGCLGVVDAWRTSINSLLEDEQSKAAEAKPEGDDTDEAESSDSEDDDARGI